MSKWTFVAIAVLMILLLLMLRTVPTRPVELDSGQRQSMGTFARVVAVGRDKAIAQKSIDAAFAQLEEVEKLLSCHSQDSEISKVNSTAAKSPVQVSQLTFDAIKTAVEFSKLTDGAFDITVGPAVLLWEKAGDANALPDSNTIRKARSLIGFNKLLLDANEMTVAFAAEGMSLDLGGIAKGYGIDLAVNAMQAAGARGGMVDVGGDIRCFGKPASRKNSWLIGLQDPNVVNERLVPLKPLLILKLTDAAMATSGNYRRYVTIAGQRYSHTLNTHTATAAQGLSSVTVIADNATKADALATAVTVLGKEKGLALIESLDNTEAILISAAPEYHLEFTSGAGAYLMQK